MVEAKRETPTARECHPVEHTVRFRQSASAVFFVSSDDTGARRATRICGAGTPGQLAASPTMVLAVALQAADADAAIAISNMQKA